MKKSAVAVSSAALGAQATVHFKETFDTLKAWKPSTWKPSSEMEEFTLKPTKYGSESDTALASDTDARFYASSATFDKFSIDSSKKSLLFQYEVTYDKDIECGGGYIKIGDASTLEADKFGDPTPYSIMFGPDKCGYSKRTHLIFTYKGKNILKTVDLPYKQDEIGVPVLYRLILSPDSDGGKVKVEVDGTSVYSGSLKDDWKLLLEKEIDDKDDKKPESWVDEPMMDDPEDKKPENWVDEKEIVDKEAKQPEDWDASEDGDWEPPMIPNPDYKGEWSAKRISNPEYKGVWAPKKIPNPDFVDDAELYKLDRKDFGFIGFDLWQVKAGSRFDNIIISTGETEEELTKEADELLEAHKSNKKAIEEKKKEEEAKTTTTTVAPTDASGDDGADMDVDDDDDEVEPAKDEDL